VLPFLAIFDVNSKAILNNHFCTVDINVDIMVLYNFEAVGFV